MAISRSGSNAFHGSAYDLFRNRLLNGRGICMGQSRLGTNFTSRGRQTRAS